MRGRKVRLVALSGVLAAQCVVVGRLLAQTPKPRPDSMAEIVVTATRSQTTADKMALHTTVITRQQIELSPARTVDQLLRDIPGMNQPGAPFYTTDPTGHQAKLRGVTNSKVLMLVDGIPVHDPFYSTTQWFKIPLSSIERIEVVRGGSSSLWGNLAVAGVINIITKQASDGAGQVDLSYQSLNTVNASAAKSFSLTPSLSVRLSGNVLTTDGYQTTPEQYLNTVPGKSASAATFYNAQLAAYYNPSSQVSAFFRAGYHQQNEDIGGYQFGTNLQKSPDVAAGLRTNLSGSSRAELKVWAQHVQFDKENGAACYLASASACNTTSLTSPLVQYANSRDWNPYNELGASATVSTALTSLSASVQGGIDFRRISGEDSARTYNRPTTTDVSSATINRISYGRGTQQFIGGFLQVAVFPVSRLEVTGSLRYDYWTNRDGIATMAKFTNGAAGPTSGGALPNSDKGAFNPSLSVRYELADGIAVRGAAYRSFRTPGLNNLYRSFSSTTSITIANPSLAPETLTGGEVGVDLQRGVFRFGATAFQYNTKGLIATYKIQDAASAPAAVLTICGTDLTGCPSTVNYYTNSQDATSRGLELTGAWQTTPRFGVTGSYTYTDSHYTATSTGDPTSVQLGAIPKSAATLGLSWRVGGRLVTSASARYNGAMYLDVNQTIRQPSFILVGATASYQITRQWEVYGSAVNLSNVIYSDNATTSAASQTLGLPRSFTAGVRWNF
jgi:iron complex outermembrane receptor protein